MTFGSCYGSATVASGPYRKRTKPLNICGVLVTERQLEALRFIRDYSASAGWPPKRSEICSALGLSATHAANFYVKALEDRGLIIRYANQSRGLRITDLGARVLEEAGR